MTYFTSKPPDLDKKHQVRVLIDPLTLIMTALSVSIFLNIGTYVDYDITWTGKALLGLGFASAGALLSAVDQGGVGWVLDTNFSSTETISFITNAVLSFIIIFMTNITINIYSQLSAINIVATVVFVQMMAIAEEWFCRAYLLNLVSNFSGSDLAGILISSAVGTTFHSAVYGNRDPKFMVIVFVSFFVLGWIYATSTEYIRGEHRTSSVPCRRISTVMLGHSLVNIASAWRGSVLNIECALVLLEVLK